MSKLPLVENGSKTPFNDLLLLKICEGLKPFETLNFGKFGLIYLEILHLVLVLFNHEESSTPI